MDRGKLFLYDPTAFLTVLIRWVLLAAQMGIVAFGGQIQVGVYLMLVWGLYVLWNTTLGVILAFRRQSALPRWAPYLVDLGVALAVFVLTGGVDGPLSWLAVVPGLIHGVSWSLGPTVAAGLIAGVVFLAASWYLNPTTWFLAIIYLGVAMLTAAIVSTIAGLIRRRVRWRAYERLKERQRKAKIERDRIEAIYNLTTALTSTLNYQRVLDTALDMAASVLLRPDSPTDQLVSAVLLFDSEGQLQVASSRRLTPTDQRKILPAAGGILAAMVEEGDPQLFSHPERDPELAQLVAVRSCQAVYCYPLRTGLDVYGVMLFAHPQKTFFDEERQAILNIVCKQASIALQNARLFQELEEEKERIMEVQEEARNKLARDLHDGPTQSVAAIAMRVNFARRLIERDPQKAAAELFKIEELARRTTSEIRHMLFTLRPLVLETQGLQAALESMAEKMRETYGQNVIIQVDSELVEQLEMNAQGVIFFLVEEAVNNARKHAQADHIWVRLKQIKPDLALLEIEDDGVGFDVQAVQSSYESRGSLGMVNLRERSELLNGVLQLDSAPGKGTRVRVFIPLTEDAASELRHRTV